MKSVIQCLCIFLLFNNVITVKVSIYYETLCSDSMGFITQQLYPNYNELANYMDIEFIPYGKATHSIIHGKYIFSCQHGFSECRGNLYHACALSQNKGDKANVEFVNCAMRNSNPSRFTSLEACARRADMDSSKLKSCTKSDEGKILLAKYGNKTWELDPNLSFVPTIIYDDKYNDTLQWQSLNNFVAVVCSKINIKPSICDGKVLNDDSWWYGDSL